MVLGMCGRYASTISVDQIRALFRTSNPPVNLAPSWNVAPTQPAMVVRRHPDSGERHLDLLRWGLVPHLTKDLKAARKPINARSETAASSGMFRAALASRRCIVPADAFYEWRAMADGKQPTRSRARMEHSSPLPGYGRVGNRPRARRFAPSQS